MNGTCEFREATGLCGKPAVEEIEQQIRVKPDPAKPNQPTSVSKKFAMCKQHAANSKAQLKEHESLKEHREARMKQLGVDLPHAEAAVQADPELVAEAEAKAEREKAAREAAAKKYKPHAETKQ